MNRLLLVSEVARLLEGKQKLCIQADKGRELQSYKIGSVKVRIEDLEVYIQKCQKRC